MGINSELFKQWIPNVIENKNRVALAVSSLAVFGALAGASPAAAASAQLDNPTARTTAAAEQIVARADKPAEHKEAAPSVEQLMTNGVPADQSTYEMTPERMANAKAIIEAGKQMNLPPRAWVIAIATSLQESKLDNLGHLGDRNDH
ncbi:hypothetical protein SAMN05444365_11842, partial [Micromonospora pattaloongensis]